MSNSSNNQFLPAVNKDTFLKIISKAQDSGCFQNFPFRNYSGIDEFIVHVLDNGESRHLHNLSEDFSLENSIDMPSLRAMVSSGFKDVEVVEIVKLLFKKLIDHFPKPEEFPLDEFAWFVYSTYGHLSLLSLIVFCVRCEKNHYQERRRYYFGKGIQEWMLKEWLESFDIECDEILRANILNQRKKSSKDVLIDPELTEMMIGKVKSAMNKKKLHFILRNREIEAKNKLNKEEQFVRAYKKYELSFESKFFGKSNEEFRDEIKRHCEKLKEKWSQEFTRLIPKGTENGKQAYIDSQYKIARLELEKKYRNLNALSYLESSFSKLIKMSQMESGKELLDLILSKENTGWGIDLKSTQLLLIKHVFALANKRWKGEEKKVLNGEVDYINSEYFCKVFIWKWVHKYCYPHLKTSTK